MTDENHLDGNALGGPLLDFFGQEMTHARGCCDSCGTVHQVGEMLVYCGASDVMRCPTCGSVVFVVATTGERTRVYLSAVRWLEPGPR